MRLAAALPASAPRRSVRGCRKRVIERVAAIRQGQAHARPLIGLVDIGRIFSPGDPGLAQHVPQCLPPDIEQRPADPDTSIEQRCGPRIPAGVSPKSEGGDGLPEIPSADQVEQSATLGPDGQPLVVPLAPNAHGACLRHQLPRSPP